MISTEIDQAIQCVTAARLEAACESGQILLSHTTWSLVKDEIPCIEKVSITVKGFHRPILTYQMDLNSGNNKT